MPAEAPAVVNLIAPLPEVGIDAIASSKLPIVGREDDPDRAWARLDGGAQAVAEPLLGAAPLGVLVPLDDFWPVRLGAADRLRRRIAGLPIEPPLTPQRRERLKRALRTIDGRRDGASYRAVAIAFFGEARVAEEPWKTSALKAQIARSAARVAGC